VSIHQTEEAEVQPAFAVEASSLDKKIEKVSKDPANADFWRVLSVQRQLPAATKSLRICRLRAFHGRKSLDYVLADEARIEGLFLCRSPMCAACMVERTKATAEVLEGALVVAAKKKYEVRFGTLTVQSSGDVADQRKTLLTSFQRFSKRLSGIAKEQGVEESGFSWSFDVTCKKNSKGELKAHVHMHFLWFVSSSIVLSKDDAFNIYESVVKNIKGSGYFLSKNAFYLNLVRNEEAEYKKVSKYVAKFIKSAYEVANSSGKAFGLRSLIVRAIEDKDAFNLYNEIVGAFVGNNWSSVGKLASKLAEVYEDEPAEPVEPAEEPEEFRVSVLPILHQVLVERNAVHLLFASMKVHSDTEVLRSVFVASIGDVCSLIESIEEQYTYIDKVLFIERMMLEHLGLQI
jgi:hypothetical protein